MLIFGHTGITLGAALLLNGALTRSHTSPTGVDGLGGQVPLLPEKPARQYRTSGTLSWFTSLADHIDIRLLLIGSLLPDIIDKPIGRVFFNDIFSNGRIFCHTLLFLIVLAVGGLYLYWRRRKTWLLVLSFGTFTHLILDQMWLEPRTLLWPLYGFTFERYATINLSHWFYDLLTHPEVTIAELVGVIVIVWFAWQLVRRGKLYSFIRNGQV